MSSRRRRRGDYGWTMPARAAAARVFEISVFPRYRLYRGKEVVLGPDKIDLLF